MGWNRRDFVATMEAGKAQAERRRARGLPTGTAAKGHVKGTAAPDPELGSWDRTRVTMRATWRTVRDGACEDYLRAVYPERYATDDEWVAL